VIWNHLTTINYSLCFHSLGSTIGWRDLSATFNRLHLQDWGLTVLQGECCPHPKPQTCCIWPRSIPGPNFVQCEIIPSLIQDQQNPLLPEWVQCTCSEAQMLTKRRCT
jgi:hypothetical protein